MPKPFDATVKDLAVQGPDDFIRIFEQPPVQPVRVLNADGRVQYAARPNRGKMDFEYEVIRLWEFPLEKMLMRGLATLPLAVLGRIPAASKLEDGLADVVHRVAERLQREAPPTQADRLLTAAFVLTGLRLPRVAARQLFQGVRAMHDSDTYQAILDEGCVDELHRTLLRQGRKRFGEPDERIRQAICDVQDRDRLEQLSERLLDVACWDELLA